MATGASSVEGAVMIFMKSLGSGWWCVTINGVEYQRPGNFDQVARWASDNMNGDNAESREVDMLSEPVLVAAQRVVEALVKPKSTQERIAEYKQKVLP